MDREYTSVWDRMEDDTLERLAENGRTQNIRDRAWAELMRRQARDEMLSYYNDDNPYQ